MRVRCTPTSKLGDPGPQCCPFLQPVDNNTSVATNTQQCTDISVSSPTCCAADLVAEHKGLQTSLNTSQPDVAGNTTTPQLAFRQASSSGSCETGTTVRPQCFPHCPSTSTGKAGHDSPTPLHPTQATACNPHIAPNHRGLLSNGLPLMEIGPWRPFHTSAKTKCHRQQHSSNAWTNYVTVAAAAGGRPASLPRTEFSTPPNPAAVPAAIQQHTMLGTSH